MRSYSVNMQNHIGRDNYIREYRTLTFDNGRQTGKTKLVLEFIINNGFRDVLYVLKNKNSESCLKDIIHDVRVYHHLDSYTDNIDVVSYKSNFRGNPKRYDLIVFDTASICDTDRSDIRVLLKEEGVVFKIG